MKKLFLIALMGLFSVGACVAKPKFKSIDNYGNATTIVVVDKDASNSISVTSAVFHNDGKEFMGMKTKRAQIM